MNFVRVRKFLSCKLLLVLLCGLWPAWAGAGCSRPITVPAAPTGRLVIIDGDGAVRGALPELLRELGREIGCEFLFPVLPRPRLHQEVIERGRMDLLLPAGRNQQRDREAQFVPLLQEPVALVVRSADQGQAPRRLAELRARSHWRAALVRSYAFSDAYVGLVEALKAGRRADFVAEPAAALRMLHAGRVQFTLMPPTALLEEGGVWRPGLALLRLPELPPMEFGVYLSLRSLPEADRRLLAEQLQKAEQDGRVRRALLKHYPPELLDWGSR